MWLFLWEGSSTKVDRAPVPESFLLNFYAPKVDKEIDGKLEDLIDGPGVDYCLNVSADLIELHLGRDEVWELGLSTSCELIQLEMCCVVCGAENWWFIIKAIWLKMTVGETMQDIKVFERRLEVLKRREEFFRDENEAFALIQASQRKWGDSWQLMECFGVTCNTKVLHSVSLCK